MDIFDQASSFYPHKSGYVSCGGDCGPTSAWLPQSVEDLGQSCEH